MTSIDTTLPRFLDRNKDKPLVGSYTILNTYKNCPHQMMRRYIAKDLGPFVETPKIKWGNAVHSAFEMRVGGGKPLPLDMNQWEAFAQPFDGQPVQVEQKIGITAERKPTGYFDANCWFRGKIDVAMIKGDTAYLPDWKTGSSKYESPFELETNAVLLQAKHPHLKKIAGCYVWLKENRVGQLYDLSHTAHTFAEMQRLMAEIAECRRTGDWEKRQSGLCGWCPVKDCENWRPRT